MIQPSAIPRMTRDAWRAQVRSMLLAGGASIEDLPGPLVRVTTKHKADVITSDLAALAERDVLRLLHRSF